MDGFAGRGAMINLTCRCGNRFAVADDLAGMSVQCQACRRLLDVPGLGDLADLDEDGTIKLREAEPNPTPTDEELLRAWLPQHKDADGNEYDLRPDMEQVIEAGGEEPPLEVKDQQRPAAPKYDPETGELIVPLALKGDEAQHVIPIPLPQTRPTLQYYQGPSLSPWRVPLALLTPANATVMLVVLVLHLFGTGALLVSCFGIFVIGIMSILVFLAIPAHYANVVEDIGFFDKDELPAVLRNMSFSEDVARPFFNMAGAMALCYAPAGVLWRMEAPLAAVALAGLGTILFPAVFLTLVTSGTVLNLRPDRVFGVIGAGIWSYAVLLVLWVLAIAVYGGGIVSTSYVSLALLDPSLTLNALATPLSFLALILGVYLMHLFCWQLGLFYRGHHERFPWVLQRHIPKPPPPRIIPRRRPASPAPPPDPTPPPPLKVPTLPGHRG